MKPHSRVAAVLIVTVAVLMSFGMLALSAGATTSPPHLVVGGFSTPSGAGYWLAYADGTIYGTGKADRNGGRYGDPWDYGVSLNGPIVGGAATPSGRGYWVDASDGGVFAYCDARYYGSMGAAHLNRPVVSMSATKTGKGYWLVAGDGGVFSFGDARFFGSTANLALDQPIVGITASASGPGYRLVARDGGIFTFGGAHFFGSLPGIGVQVTDVVGMASTPTHGGYWIARADGKVYAFGNARSFGNFAASPCDPVAAIFANPRVQGYRLVTVSGATIPFGNAPAGGHPIRTSFPCPPANQPPLQGGTLTLGGQIGPLQLGVSTEADVVANVGTPDATATGNFGVSFPNYLALGYDCSVIPGAVPLVVQPLVEAPYCGTVYYLNTKTQTLAGFNTISNRYTTAEGTRVGMSSTEAASREGQTARTGCLPLNIRLGNNEGYAGPPTSVEINIFMSAHDTVSQLTADNVANQVGVLFC